MFHCNGWCFPWAVTAAGATHVCLRKVEATRIIDAIENVGITHLCAAPTVLVGVCNAPGVRPFPRTVSITTAGAPPAPTTIAQIEALGATIDHVYGLTETYGPVTECAWQSPHWDASADVERARLKSRQGRRHADERRTGRRADARRSRHARQQRHERLLSRPRRDGRGLCRRLFS
jgi:fatty-acyl-CoA synthase